MTGAGTHETSPALDELAAYQYDLDPALVATEPVVPRDRARLLVVRSDGRLEHREFGSFPAVLRRGDVLVLNETRVIRARLHGRRESGGAAELLLLHPAGGSGFDPGARRWTALARPARRMDVGTIVTFAPGFRATVIARYDDGVCDVELDLATPLEAFLEQFGEIPLPPYVGAGGRARDDGYQTVFARVPGSVAAPTASLHFTPAVFADLERRGIEIARIVLDIGLGTFRPVSATRIAEHRMHAERYEIPVAAAERIASAKRDGRRIVAGGTTVVRALESASRPDGTLRAGSADTSIFIRPGHRFTTVDALLTNFHLPGSTLLMLVCAFAGYERTMHAYRTAIEARYRFYSFGDASFFERPDGIDGERA